MRLKTVFMGTPAFAVPTLRALYNGGYQMTCVYTRAPRPAGRGQQLRQTPVHEFAAAKGLIVRTPANFRDGQTVDDFAALGADLAVVVAYGLILPERVLEAPRLGCVNVHFSLLPRHRGPAPVERALLAGDLETGVSIMQMDQGIDTGPVLARHAVAIGPRATAGELYEQLGDLGARMMLQTVQGLATGQLKPEAQPAEGASYAAKIGAAEGQIDWRKSSNDLDRLVRALNPSPGVWFAHQGERIKVLEAEAISADAGGAEPGAVLDDQLTIACGVGALRLLRLQRPGKNPLPTADFLRGRALDRGSKLG